MKNGRKERALPARFFLVGILMVIFVFVAANNARSLQFVDTRQQALVADDTAAGDNFGEYVAVSGTVALVSAFGDDDAGESSGSAYIFRFNGSTWEQDYKLTAADAAAGDNFGISVAVDNNVAVVGATGGDDAGESSGSVYIFRYDGVTWNQEQKLTAADAAAGDNFGISVAIEGDVVVVGASGDDEASGSAYIFRFSGSTWSQTAKLTADDGAPNRLFGFSVAISGNIASISAYRKDEAAFDSGAVYMFGYNGTAWEQKQKLVGDEAAANDYFGASVTISDTLAVIGAYGGPAESGAAYVFRHDGSTWVREQKLTASGSEASRFFGNYVAISGGVATIGVYADDDAGCLSVSAQVLNAPVPTLLRGDVNNDCVVDLLDLFIPANNFGAECPQE